MQIKILQDKFYRRNIQQKQSWKTETTLKASSGSCGSGLTYKITSNILVITRGASGTGEMTDYASAMDVPWYENRENITGLVLPEGMASIGDYAFYGMTGLTGDVEIPNTVTRIGKYAFYEASFTGTLIIPASVKELGEYSFSDCDKFNTLIMRSGIQVIPEYTFAQCDSLVDVTLSSVLLSIGEHAFEGCRLITSIVIPQLVYEINSDAFNGTGLTQMSFRGN